MAVMRTFSGYTMDRIMNMPYSHFIKLYKWTELAENVETYTIACGTAAVHDERSIKALEAQKESRFIQPKIVFPKKSKDTPHV